LAHTFGTTATFFAAEVKRIGDQSFPDVPRPFLMVPDLESLNSATRGHSITAAIAILEDGKARTATCHPERSAPELVEGARSRRAGGSGFQRPRKPRCCERQRPHQPR
jgi:hypothetical protein